jgi:hypothetical protein
MPKKKLDANPSLQVDGNTGEPHCCVADWKGRVQTPHPLPRTGTTKIQKRTLTSVDSRSNGHHPHKHLAVLKNMITRQRWCQMNLFWSCAASTALAQAVMNTKLRETRT